MTTRHLGPGRPGGLLCALALLASLLSCAELPAVPAAVCGNGVVEEGEDCDTFSAELDTACAGASEPQPCRFVCAPPGFGADETSSKAACPSRFTCGVDGICRQPSGTFVRAGRPIESASTSLQAGDFDADGLADLLAFGETDSAGRGVARVIFFSDSAERASLAQVPGLVARPAAARFTNTPYDGLAFLSLPGISTVIGRRDRSFFARAYALAPLPPGITDARFYSFNTLSPPSSQLLAFGTILGSPTLARTPDGTPLPLRRFAAGASGLAGDLVWGPLLGPGEACPTIVMAFRGETEVQLFTPCKPDQGQLVWVDPGDDSTLIKLGLPAGLKVSGGAQLFDIDGDGRLDILVGVDQTGTSEQPALAVIFGSGTASLGSEKIGGKPGEFGLVPVVESPACSFSPPDVPGVSLALYPLAVGRFNDDPFPDFVYPHGACVSHAAPGDLLPSFSLYPNLGQRWSEARVADMNADGLPDFVASNGEALALEVYLNSPLGTFNPATVPLTGAADMLRLGDFDGDGAADVLFREQGLSGQSNEATKLGQALSVLFGAAGGIPAETARMSRFDQINHIASDYFNSFGFTDAMSDTTVIHQTNEAKGLSSALLFGSTDRVMRAPLAMASVGLGGDGAFSTAFRLAPGNFSEHAVAVQRDLVVLAASTDENSFELGAMQLWLTTMKDDAQVNALSSSVDLPGAFAPSKSVFLGTDAVLTAGNIDATPLDEALVLAPDPASPAASSLLVVGRVGDASKGFSLSAPVSLPAPVGPRSQLGVTDLDGDGSGDLIFTTPSSPGSASRLVVAWSRGDGAFDAPLDVRLPDDQASGFCALRSSPDGPRSLLVLGQQRAYRLARGASPRSLEPAAVRERNATAFLPGGTAIACGDFDGDGVDDVAISSNSVIRIFRGVPAL